MGGPVDPYAEVTEAPGLGATPEHLAMLYTRYHLAATLGRGREVLEVACGPGMGLGLIARGARRLVGGDYSPTLLRMARAHYGDRIPLLRLDAHALPFRDASFDLVLLYEAIYYLARPEAFLAEARRLLRPGGRVVICTANRDRPAFVPSPYTHRYFSAHELRHLLEQHGFRAEVFGAFPVSEGGVVARLRDLGRRLVVGLNLVPGSLRARQLLKRLAYGRLRPFPSEVTEGMAPAHPLVPLSGEGPEPGYKVLYAVGHLP